MHTLSLGELDAVMLGNAAVSLVLGLTISDIMTSFFLAYIIIIY